MTTAGTARSALTVRDLDPAADRFVLVDTGGPSGLVLLAWGRRDALLARLLGRRLDTRLATGAGAESSRRLAVRATQLVAPASRRRIAGRWDVLAAAARCRPGSSQHEVADEIQQVADRLRSHSPIAVRGVALASTMLDVAAGAVRRPGPGGEDVAAAVARTALAAM